MLVSFSISLFALISSPPQLYAYKIDDSCKGKDAELVRDGANEAFSMADAAISALQSRANDPDVNRLITLLFGQNPDVQRVLQVYQGIATMKLEKGPNVDISKIAEEVKQEGWWDNASEQVIGDSDDGHSLDDCKPGVRDGTLAFTWIPETYPKFPQFGEVPIGYPSQVNICPWFLQWASRQKYKKWADIDEGKFKAQVARGGVMGYTTWRHYTPFDAFELFDKVLLHELTHTKSAGNLDDVVFDGGDPNNENKGYGWKSVTALASQAWPGQKISAYYNADTFALFGSAIRLLNEPFTTYVTDKGKITTKNPLSKRSVPFELQYRDTPAAFETFITVVKRERARATGVSLLSL